MKHDTGEHQPITSYHQLVLNAFFNALKNYLLISNIKKFHFQIIKSKLKLHIFPSIGILR